MKKTILLAAMAACLFATNVFAQKIKVAILVCLLPRLKPRIS